MLFIAGVARQIKSEKLKITGDVRKFKVQVWRLDVSDVSERANGDGETSADGSRDLALALALICVTARSQSAFGSGDEKQVLLKGLSWFPQQP